MGDVKEGLGLAVDVAESSPEGALDEVDAVVGLLEAQGLVGEGAHHPGGVAVGVGFAGELVADLVVALGGAFLAEVVVLPPCEVGEFGYGAEGCPA
ncbi:hypothetical protein GCM10015535_16930 [Streptomyces gelaticus]|uniref:Uncharacterized protein n=1 Tax=Streptomyces gelaticus TaxID=285446 RepID=A0ABQ2VWZ5_9ACTN|nr:hypothetical protein GCM10015535_16930 [Streptomyces gelaticus]